ncbi:rap guanine nucleotide exchange factor 1-like isoform X2 [Liolophura sinensis]|uniref:rap guanine nucleotide exchange factor 1-like isoform X2 n=1 Tax=Liolophura sinensis TaxID=3198878 RepID=UPI003158641E
MDTNRWSSPVTSRPPTPRHRFFTLRPGDLSRDKSSSKVLKKARSFRDDFKVLIKRRPSSNQALSPVKTHRNNGKGGKSGLMRHNSMNEGTKVEKLVEKDDDIDKLKDEVANVHRSLGYIKEVVDKEKLQILPGSATIVLDTVMEVFTLLSNYFMNQESSTLISRHNQVYQSLARFIRWSDDILLHGDKALNKDNANEVIRALSDGVKELTQISIDKLELRKTSAPTSPGSNGSASLQESYSSKTCSLPDIPLTPREREILAETSVDTGMYDNTDRLSHSNDSLINNNYVTLSDKESSPPPKPPLPSGRVSPNLHIGSLGRPSSGEVMQTSIAPPPLPQKRRSQGGSDLMTSTPNTDMEQVSRLSPHSSMSSPSGDQAMGSLSSHLATFSQSPRSTSPLSRSPTSSVGSGLNQSTEDLLGMSSKGSSLTNSVSVTSSSTGSTPTSDPSLSMYDNMNMPAIGERIPGMTQCVDQINQLTFKINQLTTNIEEKPPLLPDKKRQFGRFPSTYDNLPDAFFHMPGTKVVVGRMFEQRTSSMSSSRSLTTCSITQRTSSQETYSSSETFSSTSHSSMESLPNRPPPLPPKKRHIHAYMQTIGSYTQPSALEYLPRHSINFYESQWHRHQEELFQPLQVRSNTISVMSDLSSGSSDLFSLEDGFSSASPPALPSKQRALPCSSHSSASGQYDFNIDLREKASSLIETPTSLTVDFGNDLKRSSAPANMDEPSAERKPASPKPDIQKDADSDFAELNPLDDVDVSDQMVRKKKGEDGPDIRGGTVDALIVHATTAGKNDLMYQEAFLTTYRTFISPRELIDKLLYRFHKFHHCSDHKKRASRNAFSLLVRIIDELSSTELDDSIIQRMMDLVFELLCQGELMLARLLRRKIIEKCEARKKAQEASKLVHLLSSKSISTHPPDLLQFKSHDLAEQMTLMDATLFQKIEIPEVLLWAKEQSEELSPNLTLFTEHFNKMSYWCRTKILVQEEAKDREKYLMKFIKIMRHLRKISNFNSYLAILSALDSAPVRRLEWQKQNMEALKEFCQLIDSSSSFRAYRQALAETEPPCIPYIGLILQDLTFINIGNPDYLADGSINFAKRWQQFNILDNMRRFKKCNYPIKRSEKVLSVFNNFDDYHSEETLWQISEKIKPRGGVKKKVESTEEAKAS